MGEVQQLFTTKTALRVTGATRGNLDQWVVKGVVIPTRPGGPRAGHRWTFRDLVQIRTLVELRQAGITLAAVCQVAEYLRSYNEDFGSTFLLVMGGDVFIEHGDQLISALKNPGQLTIVYALEKTASAVREALAA